MRKQIKRQAHTATRRQGFVFKQSTLIWFKFCTSSWRSGFWLFIFLAGSWSSYLCFLAAPDFRKATSANLSKPWTTWAPAYASIGEASYRILDSLSKDWKIRKRNHILELKVSCQKYTSMCYYHEQIPAFFFFFPKARMCVSSGLKPALAREWCCGCKRLLAFLGPNVDESAPYLND